MITPTTKLQAVNTMLSTIGEAPVNNLASGLIDAETAESTLNEVSRSVQSIGWNFNTEPNYTFAQNSKGEVELAANVIRADLSKTKFRSSKNEYIQRGNRIYDKVNHTYNIGKNLTLDVVVLLNFDELPEVARHFIAIKSSRLFQERVVGSDTLSAMNRNDEQKALYALQELEGDDGDHNIFDDYGTASALDRRIGTKVITNGSSF